MVPLILYHGNPIDELGSIVTYHYGYDLFAVVAGPPILFMCDPALFGSKQ